MIEQQLLAIINTYNSDGYYKYGNIPSKKLESAIQHYPVDPSDTPLALVDATIMGSAKTGMVIGLKGIYWGNDWKVKTEKNFLSWEELANKGNKVSTSFYDLQLMPGCEFGMSGASMKKDLLANLLNQIIALYKDIQQSLYSQEVSSNTDNVTPQHIALIEQSTNLYAELIPELIALCIVADGDVEDSEIELATAIIESDELILDKHIALESLSNSIEKLLADRQKSSAIFKLKSTTIISKVVKITNTLEKERLSIILDGMLDSVNQDDTSDTVSIVNAIKSKISI
jgi:hypothetical protein